LAAGASCNFAAIFSPSQVNARTGSLTINGPGLTIPLVVALSGNGAGFTMDGPASELVNGGQSGVTFSVNINSENGSRGPVSLSCSVQPAAATCKVSPASVALTGVSGQSATVSFSAEQQARSAGSNWKEIGLVLAMLVPFGFIGGRSRKWRALVACLVFVLIVPIGCGVASSAGSDPGDGGGGSPPSSAVYTLTVTGGMPGLTRTVTTKVTVE
jgi:hypothetical protein